MLYAIYDAVSGFIERHEGAMCLAVWFGAIILTGLLEAL